LPEDATPRSSLHLRCLPIQGPTIRGLDLPLIATLDIIKRERRSTCTFRLNKGKHEQLIINKTYPTKVVINSGFLDMQGYKGLTDSAEAATKGGSLLLIFYLNNLAIFIILE
jgi:hypothetical protein